MATSATPAPESAGRPWLNRAVTTTPVVLSVLATVLAGLSSRELTLAHYYRSLATQQQSKADDQWNFFQAKKIRGTVVETAGDAGDAPPERIAAARLEEAAVRLTEDLGRAGREAERLRQAIDAAGADLGTAGGPLRDAAGRLVADLEERAARADRARRRLAQTLTRPEFQEALRYLDGDSVPEAAKRPITDEKLRKAVEAVRAREPDSALAPLVRPIDPAHLGKAIEDAEANGRDFDAGAKPVGDALKQLGKLTAQQSALVGPVSRAMRQVRSALADLPAGDRKGLNDVRTAAAALDRTTAALDAAAQEVPRDFRAAERAYTARRYDREARYNQEEAELYEVQVRMLGEISEGHRKKSALIFYTMLAAQGGVTIAALAMAVRYKSVLWSLATVAGLSALLFASYVFVGI